MADGGFDLGQSRREKAERDAAARERAFSIPIEQIDVTDPELWINDTHWPYFERLRKEAPIHRCETNEEVGPYWSITSYDDIMAIDTNHQVFSVRRPCWAASRMRGQATIELLLPMFIAMDPPKHDVQRKTVSPVVSPASLMQLEPIIRERAAGHPGQPAGGRDLRLGRPHLDRTDDPDAGHPVRLPVP
jgi:cytochrome P450